MKRLIGYYRPYAAAFFADLACAFTISAIDIAFPLILHYCLYTLFRAGPAAVLSGLWVVAVSLFALYTVRAFCRYYVSAQGHIMGAKMEADMRSDLFHQYQRLSFSYYDKNNTGVMMSRVVSDLFDISEFAHHGPENLFISLIKIIGSFTIMMILYWPLALILLGITLLMLAFSLTQNKTMRATFRDNRRKIGAVNASLQDSLGGIRVVQSFGNSDIEVEKFETSNQAFLNSKKRNYYAMGRFHSGNNFFQGLLYVTLVLAGGLFVARGNLAPATLATFALYINVFVSPIELLVELTEMVQKGMSGFARFAEVMEQIPEIKDGPQARDIGPMQGAVSFRDVSFRYEEEEKVLHHISFDIEPGTKLALVGPSGGGKSTVCSLISRFYDVSEGSVLIDGHDVRDYTLRSLRAGIGLVQQEVYLFNGTIAENIGYGKPGAPIEEITAAAKQANIHDFVMTLPDGYDTRVGERGARLSGGQKQRISIARVFLKNPKILILDEATSALDNESERIIQEALETLSIGRTCITIAHRLSTIRHSDRILVIDDGYLRESGSHAELLRQNGIYAKYHQLQMEESVLMPEYGENRHKSECDFVKNEENI
ncbi:MAG: ABC transporter ATP-binding protein [Lachnospiraceae bacterium]|nr:ABC transporter ATP-binding protein [Lachnospiraceae bacterium]MDY5741699.1 ABC transporter ATP-binding protein [Lachnospiraceae bacterium]